MKRFLIFRHEKEAVMTPHKVVYKGTQEKGKQFNSPLSLLSLRLLLHHAFFIT
jgi:hypothetical protein